jgi:hypothetical protein
VKTVSAVVSLAGAAVMVVLSSSVPAEAADTTKRAVPLVSPPLSINPNDGQPMCLVSNLGTTATVSVIVEIIDASGTSMVTSELDVPPGGVEAATDALQNFYSYCRITPKDATYRPLIRGSHCSVYLNSVKACVEAR